MSTDDPIAPENDPLVGLPYRAIRLLGEGGMGQVFLVEHRKLGRRCVAKILHAHLAGDPRIIDRIRLEAQSLGGLDHPNIVSIVAAGRTHDERPFIVMELLRGQTLGDELATRGQLPVLEALAYTCQLLHALAAAHALGIIHRDVKPNNLFLCEGPGGVRTLKVLDFGIARVIPGAAPQGPHPLAVPTDTGMVVGTPRYVSPEGATGRPVDHRADLYSAALVLYVAIAGRGPFDHIQNGPLLLSAHASEAPEPPSRFAKEPIPPELDRAILRALRKAPDDRFQTADELREELERVMALLAQAPGWLETSAFDASVFRASRGAVSEVDRGSGPNTPQGTNAAERSSQQVRFDIVAIEDRIEGTAEIATALKGTRGVSIGEAKDAERPISVGSVALLFLSGAVVAAAAAAAIIMLLRVAR